MANSKNSRSSVQSTVESTAAVLRELVAHLRENRTQLREEWARRITEAQLLTAMSKEEIFAEATSIWGTIFAAESGAVHEEMYAGHASEYNSILREVLEQAFRVRGVDYARAHAKRQAIRRVFDNLFEPVDLLLWPAMSGVAQPVEVVAPGGRISPERAEDLLRFTAPLSLTGHPVLSLPCGFNSEGIPIGLQLIARHGEEAALLRAGFAYQEATDWHKRKPPLEP